MKEREATNKLQGQVCNQYKYSIPIVVVWLFCRRDLPFILRSQHEKGCTLSHLLSKIEKGVLISPPLRLLFMLFKCLHSDLEQNDICIIIGTLLNKDFQRQQLLLLDLAQSSFMLGMEIHCVKLSISRPLQSLQTAAADNQQSH